MPFHPQSIGHKSRHGIIPQKVLILRPGIKTPIESLHLAQPVVRKDRHRIPHPAPVRRAHIKVHGCHLHVALLQHPMRRLAAILVLHQNPHSLPLR